MTNWACHQCRSVEAHPRNPVVVAMEERSKARITTQQSESGRVTEDRNCRLSVACSHANGVPQYKGNIDGQIGNMQLQ